MATLILIDVDNLLPYGARPPADQARSSTPLTQDRPPAGQEAVRGCFETLGPLLPTFRKDPRCVVVCALNTVSVRTRRFSLGDLRMLARGAASRCIQKAQVESIEVLLALNMPEAADGALLRAISWAADPVGAILVHEILLLSQDRALREAIPGTKTPLQQAQGRTSLHACQIRPRTPIQRALPSPRPTVGTLPATSGWLALNNPALAGAVAALPPQASPKDLVDLANLVEQHPAYLSQFGPTLCSHRGAARLSLLLDGKPTLACHEDDGLEHLGEKPASAALRTGEGDLARSSLGHGAVTLSTPGARHVLRTSLPGHFLRDVFPLSRRRIQDNHLPDEHLLGVGHEARTGIKTALQFAFLPGTGGVRCILTAPDDGSVPASWWVFQKKDPGKQGLSTTIKYQAPVSRANLLMSTRILGVAGNMVTADIGERAELVCRSPLRVGEVVNLDRNAARNELVLASNTAVAGGEPCAFLALGRSWTRGQEVEAVAIQHADAHLLRAHGLSDEEIRHLRRLPIVIPLQILGDLPKGTPTTQRQGAP